MSNQELSRAWDAQYAVADDASCVNRRSLDATQVQETESGEAAVTEVSRHHNVPRISLIVLTLIVYVVSEGVFQPKEGSRLFRLTEAKLSSRFESPLDASSTLDDIVWPVVYVFQAAWLLLAIYAVFRKTEAVQIRSDGSRVTMRSYLYLYPDIFKTHTFYLFIVTQLLIVACRFIYDNEILVAKIVAQILIHLLLLTASVFVCKGVKLFVDEGNDSGVRFAPILKGTRKYYELFALRLFFLNGVCLYASWALFRSMIGLCSFMIHIEFLTVQKDIASILCVNFLLMHFVIFAVLDNFYFDEYTRYIFSPYIVGIVSVAGSVSNAFNARDAIKMETVMALVFFVGFTMNKVFNLVRRSMR